MKMTDRTTGSGSPPGFSPQRAGRPPPLGRLSAWARRATLLLVAACLLPSSPLLLRNHESPTRGEEEAVQLRAGGARWLESHNHEVVHFVCEPGAPYTVSLVGASLSMAGIPRDEHGAYLEALREAVNDWREILRCPRIRAEMDSPYAETQVAFTPISTSSTLAMGTRAQHIVLNATRAWFPGNKRQGTFSGGERAVSFYWVVAHELGHVWGLAHSDSPDSLMYPSQCETCRWSSFEQAAGNLIHAASLVPDWSRPHWTNRFFVKTPIAVVERLLTGELPDEPLWSSPEDHCVEEGGAGSYDGHLGPTACGSYDVTPRSSLKGAGAVRHLRPTDLRHRRAQVADAPLTPPMDAPEPAPSLPDSAELPGDLPPALPPRWATPGTEEWLVTHRLL